MRALSIRQPWAWLICKGYKDIENREWSLPAYGVFPPQRVYVHTGLNKGGWDRHFQGKTLEEYKFIKERLPHIQFPLELYYGGIIGEVDIISCIEHSYSVWFLGRYGFTLANPVLYEKPIPCRGMGGFFDPTKYGQGELPVVKG